MRAIPALGHGHPLAAALACLLPLQAQAASAPALDLSVQGGGGRITAKAALALPPSFLLPAGATTTAAFAASVQDPILCVGYGEDPVALGAELTDANATASVLTGIDRADYLLGDGSRRGELRWVSQLVDGQPRLQCTSPGYALGREGPHFDFDTLLVTSFEAEDAAADVVLAVGGVADQRIGVAAGGDGTRLELIVLNRGGSPAAAVRLREYASSGGNSALLRVAAGTDGVSCTPLGGILPSDPCAALATATAFPFAVELPGLAPGQGVRLRLHRQLLVPLGQETASAVGGYAAFVDPAPSFASAVADAGLANNALWLSFAVS